MVERASARETAMRVALGTVAAHLLEQAAGVRLVSHVVAIGPVAAPDDAALPTPDDVAADPDVELVVVSTRVDKHYETGLASVRAGKHVYVEWPLAQNVDKAGELAKLAREKGGKTIIGLQVR